jgi:hypothetical protein
MLVQPGTLTQKEIKNYWKRLTVRDADVKEDKRILTIESFTSPCRIGLKLDKENHCPICFLSEPEKDIPKSLEIIETITRLSIEKK